ncbi:MAG: TonB-dependent receptor domain-containing protein [Bryobacteraceae bacterium]
MKQAGAFPFKGMWNICASEFLKCTRVLLAIVLLLAACGAAAAQTGGGATLVGTVRDTTGGGIPEARVTVLNTATSFVSETTTTAEGGYYVPYLIPGNYRLTVTAPGFKQYVRDGITLRSAEVLRLDMVLEVGGITESVTVTGEAPQLNTENVMTAATADSKILPIVPGLMRRTVYLLQYMPGVIAVVTQQGFHIGGQAQEAIGFTMDGINAKTPYLGTVNQVDGVLQGNMDALEEVKVLTTGVPAEYGQASGGAVKMVYKTGTNNLHASLEYRYLDGKWVHRHYLQQNPTTNPWDYRTADFVISGPVLLPKLYNGKNRTFWLFDYGINHENTIYESRTTVPNEAMLNGDFSFPQAPGGGLPIYNPFTTRQAGSTWLRDPFPNNLIPKSLFDEVSKRFLALKIWRDPNLVGSMTRTGPSENLLVEYNRRLKRDRWNAKVDHQFSPSHKIFVRVSHAYHRGRYGTTLARPEFGTDFLNPTDQVNGVFSDTYVFSPVMFNEFRAGYMRRAGSTPKRFGADENWAQKLGIPGVGPETFPYFNIGYGIGALNRSREVGEDRILQNNVTRIAGRHSLKTGYQMMWTLYSRADPELPSGQYNFGGTELPFTPNTGITFASFLLGTVSSAVFTRNLALYLPRQWTHELYFQDDWKVTSRVALNLGVRWTYTSPFKTKYGQQSLFRPDATDPLTGKMGAITHPSGIIGTRDWNNLQPRVGVVWHFHKKWVFRSSFGIITMENPGQAGFEEYAGRFDITQPTGDPRHQFVLSQGPGVIAYRVLPDGTVPFTGTSYGTRQATWRDLNLRNPYVMNWLGGFQYEFAPTWLLDVHYHGTAGVKLTRSWNINTIPLSIALSGDKAMQDKVYAAQQNYRYYPHFGTINLLSNFNHNTYHSGNIRVEKRYSQGLSVNAYYTISKTLSNADDLTYYNRQGKARVSYDRRHNFGSLVTYELPIGKNKRWLNRGGILNAVVGGWMLANSLQMVSGVPLSVGFAGSPHKYLTTTRVNALAPIESAKVANWKMGHRFPIAAQNPYFRMDVFAYPAEYTIGSLGPRVLQAPGIVWNEVFATKSWTVKERGKLTLRVDGRNLPWKMPNLAAPNTTYNLNSPSTWGRFTGTLGDFSNYGSGMANVQASIRAEW